MDFEFYRPPKRTYEVENPTQAGQVLHLHPPLLAAVRKLDEKQTLDSAEVLACELLSRNAEDVTITAAELRTHVEFDQLWEFLRGYRGWVAGTVASDPN